MHSAKAEQERAKTLVIKPLADDERQAAVKLCAQAMNDNPVHVQVFGAEPQLRERRLQRLFPALLAHVRRRGHLYGVFVEQGGQVSLVGVLGMLPPKRCKPSVRDMIRLLPRLVTASHPLGVLRLARWLGTWAWIDPVVPHWHLGPLAIAPQWQRQGIGTRMIEFAFEQCVGASLYLETDKLSNVQLYERYGFKVVGRPAILGVSSWVMAREAER